MKTPALAILAFAAIILAFLVLAPDVRALTAGVPVPTDDRKNAAIEEEKKDCPWPTLARLSKIFSRDSRKTHGENFWTEIEAGWFFGDEEEQESEEKCEVESLSFITADFLRKLPAPVFRELLTDLLNYAVTNPTKKNVAVYMFAQWIAREKAEKFMVAWQDVLRAHPALDYTVARAPFAYATKEQTLRTLSARKRFLKEAAARDEIALVAFVSPECVYCVSEMPILLRIRERYGLRISFVNVAERPEMISRFGIEALPEVWLAVKGHGMTRITAGLRSEDEILEAAVKAYEQMTGKKVLPDIYKYTVKPEEIDLSSQEPFKEVSPWRSEKLPLH